MILFLSNYEDVIFFFLEMPVPIAIIVCEGDIETIHHITKALKNKLPVIIIKGSGKAADFVLDALEKYHQQFSYCDKYLSINYNRTVCVHDHIKQFYLFTIVYYTYKQFLFQCILFNVDTLIFVVLL